jgi:hypothetical protein
MPRFDEMAIAVLITAALATIVAGAIALVPDRATSATLATVAATLAIAAAALEYAFAKRRVVALQRRLAEVSADLEGVLVEQHATAPSARGAPARR